MLTVAVLVSLLAFVSAHGNNNMMGGGMNNQFGHGMYGQGMMGSGMGVGGNNWMGNMGMHNNGMSQLLRYFMGNHGGNNGGYTGGNMGGMGGNMNGGQMGGSGHMGGMGGQQGMMGGNGQRGGMGGQQGMMGGMAFLLLQNLLQNKGGNGNQCDQMNKEEMEGAEKLMKKKMMMEMAEMMAMYMDHKEKEDEFKEAMEYMCYMVNATYEAHRRNRSEVYQKTDDAMMTSLGKQVEQMGESEKMDYTVKMMMDEPQKYAEIFLRFATWACMSGDAYVNSAMKMEKMERGEGECVHD